MRLFHSVSHHYRQALKLFKRNVSEEERLISGCLAGKRLVQKQLYDLYSGKMLVVCMRYAKTTFEAEDILQDGFVSVFKNIQSFKGDCPLEFWIRKIMVNTALKYYRKKAHLHVSTDSEDLTNLPDDEVIESQYNLEELLEMIQMLAPRYQVIFNLYAIEGYNHREIGEQLGISEGTSKSQYARARAILKKTLDQQEKTYHEKVNS